MAERSRNIKINLVDIITTTLSFKTRETQPVQYSPYSQGFLLPGNRTGLASAAMAWRLWKVEPIRSHSLVPICGAFGPSGR